MKSKDGKSQREEKSRRERSKREKIREEKESKEEDAGALKRRKVAKHCPEGRKIGSLKRRVRGHLGR